MSSTLRCLFERRNLTVINSGAGSLAFIIRAGVNLILLLTRLKQIRRYGTVASIVHENPWLIVSSREHRFAVIKHALFGQDCFRFAAMLGT